MAHLRTTILNALVTVLATAGTGAGARVYKERPIAIATDEIPFIRITLPNESQSAVSLGGGGPQSRILDREATLIISYTMKQQDGYIDDGNEAMRLIESALSYAVIAGLKDIQPTSTLFDEEQDGEHQLYTVTQQFSLSYMTTQGDPHLSR